MRGTAVVRARRLTEHFSGYAQVVPIALVPVRAVEPGVVADLRAVPGTPVRAGQVLARLSGPEIRSLLLRLRSAARSSRVRLAAARRMLAIARSQLGAQLSTLQAVAGARSAVAAATASDEAARVRWRTAVGLSELSAPATGTVLGVNAGDGERVAAGETVLTVQANDRLWLAATYYGADAAAIQVGMRGRFQPAADGAPVPVRVAAVSAALDAGGGEQVGLVPARSTAGTGAVPALPWMSGERGTVTLEGGTRTMAVVPTRALILDQARWWVLVRTPKGVRRQAVVPGPTRGWETFIARGLSPGEQIVVENAFLEFHRGIARRYTPPD